MTTEEKLKELILSRYQSLREFTIEIEIAYSTFDSIMRRGIQHANILNVLKICSVLHISADSLAHGEIVPIPIIEKDSEESDTHDVEEILKNTRRRLSNYHDLTFNGKPADQDSIDHILQALDLGIELARRKK